MQMHRLSCCPHRGVVYGEHLIPIRSRLSVVALAKRKGVNKELREIQQLKESNSLTAAVSSPSASPPVIPSFPTTPVPTAPASTLASESALSDPATSVPSQSPATSSASASTPNPANSDSRTGVSSGIFDSLLIRILAAVTAIMAVISVFYSIVFYGASNAVYVFKDQLAAITKKDFVPYSERRRLEQEVLAKLEAEQAERLKVRGSGQEVLAAQDDPSQAPVTSAEPTEEDASSNQELLNLLPGSKKM